MIDDLIDKIVDRYGVLGALIVFISAIILLGGWIFICSIYPVFVFTPLLVFGLMIWAVTRKETPHE